MTKQHVLENLLLIKMEIIQMRPKLQNKLLQVRLYVINTQFIEVIILCKACKTYTKRY